MGLSKCGRRAVTCHFKRSPLKEPIKRRPTAPGTRKGTLLDILQQTGLEKDDLIELL